MTEAVFHYEVASTDPDEIRAHLARMTGSGRAQLVDVDVPWKFRYEQRVDGDDRFNIVRLKSSGGSRGAKDVNPHPGERFITIAMVNSGEFSVRDAAGRWWDTALPILFTTDQALVVQQFDVDLTIVSFSTPFLLERARSRSRLDLMALNLVPEGPPSKAAILHWQMLVRHVTSSIIGKSFDDQRTRDNALNALADAAFDLFAFDRPEGPTVTTARSALVARTMREIDDRLDQPISMSTLTAALGVSDRVLRREFSTYVGSPPLAIVKREKLHAVRVDLMAADSRRTSVRELAQRWGFQSFGHFAASYEAEFGELPNDTLRRQREH